MFSNQLMGAFVMLANIIAAIAALLIFFDLVLWHSTGPNGYRTHILLQVGCVLLAVAVLLGVPGFLAIRS